MARLTFLMVHPATKIDPDFNFFPPRFDLTFAAFSFEYRNLTPDKENNMVDLSMNLWFLFGLKEPNRHL